MPRGIEAVLFLFFYVDRINSLFENGESPISASRRFLNPRVTFFPDGKPDPSLMNDQKIEGEDQGWLLFILPLNVRIAEDLLVKIIIIKLVWGTLSAGAADIMLFDPACRKKLKDTDTKSMRTWAMASVSRYLQMAGAR
jgi:hypothetical protein